MDRPLTFQEIILKLQDFWASHGCLIWQPYYTQVGAGTMNPATFLRVLGPEPWNVAYVEPSVRPDDGRYGENPNRLQHALPVSGHPQARPGNPQELYLESLEALGIDPRQHDIRFVEDNWEQPAIWAPGAWAGRSGWTGRRSRSSPTSSRWAASPLDPVSVEITYGLERILIALQNVRDFRAICSGARRAPTARSAGRARTSTANIISKSPMWSALRQMYDLFEAEADACLEQGLVLPAHDYVLKCSHTFNILDARGAIGVTERQAFFGRMRDLARRVAEAYVEQRQRLEFPWLVKKSMSDERQSAVTEPAACAQAIADPDRSPPTSCSKSAPKNCPPRDLDSALAQLQRARPGPAGRAAPGARRGCACSARRAGWWSIVEDLAAAPARPRPAWSKARRPARAFDALGQPTKAAEGFARSKGVEVSRPGGARDRRRQLRGRRGARSRAAPRRRCWPRRCPGWSPAIKFDKSMRWNASQRGLLAPDPLAGGAAGRAGHAVRVRRAAVRARDARAALPRARGI